MPPIPYRTTLIVVTAGAALIALAILVGRGDGARGVLIEARPAPPGVDEIRVDVGGEVAMPGVFTLTPSSRVIDAIEAAGGVTTDGDLAPLNLARRVIDEDRIRVPTRGERSAALDLNAATRAQLEALPGIGAARATAILEARAERPFTSSDELQTRGLAPASVYLAIRDLVATPSTAGASP
jgi:competence protein ComEA